MEGLRDGGVLLGFSDRIQSGVKPRAVQRASTLNEVFENSAKFQMKICTKKFLRRCIMWSNTPNTQSDVAF